MNKVEEAQIDKLTNQPFLMSIDDSRNLDGGGLTVAGHVRKGVVRAGDQVEIVGSKATVNAKIKGLQKSYIPVDEAKAGDDVDVLFGDMSIEDMDGSKVLAAPGSIRWYVLHAYSGHENRVKTNLDLHIQNTVDMEYEILEVFVPKEDEVEIQGGERKTISTRVFPGYIFVHMRLVEEDDESWHMVRNTPGVTGFISAEDDRDSRAKPVPLDKREEENILGFKLSDQPRVRIGFTKGQSVRITDGPFVDFMGVVDEVHANRTKLKVLVSFFGRETPVELDFLQVERA